MTVRPMRRRVPRLRKLRVRRLRARRGFTLPELLVAVIVMTVGVLALASTSAGVLRQMRDGNLQSLATIAIQSRLEQMRATVCTSQSSGTATTRGMTERWTITAISSKIYTVADTVIYVPRAGKTRTVGVNLVIPCA